MMSVLRQLPRKSRIISAVRQAAMTASRTTPSIDGAHEDRLVGERLDLELRRQAGGDPRQRLLDARRRCRASRPLPVLMHRQQRARAGRRRARCWSAAGSRRARARRRGCRSCAPLTVLIGRSLSSSTVSGLPFMPHVVFDAADLRRAGRQDQVLRADRVDDVGRREALRLQRRRVEVDQDLRAACRRRRTGSTRPARSPAAARRKLTPRS